jgi:hypothetical protein
MHCPRICGFLPARSVEKAPAKAMHAPVDLDTIEDDLGPGCSHPIRTEMAPPG